MTPEQLQQGNELSNDIALINVNLLQLSSGTFDTALLKLDAVNRIYQSNYDRIKDVPTINSMNIVIDDFTDSIVQTLTSRKAELQLAYDNLSGNQSNTHP
jgi:hypothetical protein